MDFWNAISNSLHNPRRLVFKTFIRVYQEDVEAFWKACSRFEEIDYDGSEQWIHDGFKDQYFPRLKRLHYSTSDGTMSTLLKWLPNCRNLKDLKCITRIEPIEVQSFANIVKETWPFMESLELGSTSGTDEVFAILMRSLPALKNWGLGGGSFGLEAFTQLRNRHFDTLTTLRMANIDLFSSEMVLELEEIDVSRPYGRMTVSPAPQWRLDHGLSQLKTLKRLRRFACDNNHLDMGFKDVQWILDHWPSLKIFTGTVAQYPIDQDAITKLVRERLRLK
ncbi:hypothetical protein FBU30_004575 [Linnemannia zychae]|nr:hypothetical protein FBU30_004575 [Linnemannia zychae]